MQSEAKYKVGDRVLIKQHSDWKNDIVGTISRDGHIRKNSFGGTYIDYFVTFDIEQADLTDELHGDFDRRYWGSTCAEQYLEPLVDSK
jgi:hypothetical protein